jgi:hypothetical protein
MKNPPFMKNRERYANPILPGAVTPEYGFSSGELEPRRKRMQDQVHAIAVDIPTRNVYPTEERIREELPHDLRVGGAKCARQFVTH